MIDIERYIFFGMILLNEKSNNLLELQIKVKEI